MEAPVIARAMLTQPSNECPCARLHPGRVESVPASTHDCLHTFPSPFTFRDLHAPKTALLPA